MTRGDPNYILPYKTNIEVVTKAEMGLNHSVYVALWLKTKFDGNNCAFVTLFVLDNLKCPGGTQNHELINLVKPLHIKSWTGSQTSVVSIYAHTISHIWRKNIFLIVLDPVMLRGYIKYGKEHTVKCIAKKIPKKYIAISYKAALRFGSCVDKLFNITWISIKIFT